MADQPPQQIAEEPPSSQRAASGAASSTSNPFVGDTGPGFNPDAAPPPVDAGAPAGAIALEIPVIEEDQVRSVLKNGGDLAHATVGVGQLDWVMTDTDQDRIAPPLTRIINRHEQLARVMGHSDELAVAIGTGLYTWRSLLEREGVLRAERAPQTAPQPAPAPQEPVAETEAGFTVPDGYIPEAYRRFGRRPGQETP